MLDATFGIWVILRPQCDELIEVVRPEDGPITGQVVKVVHDDSHEQVDDLRQWTHVHSLN